MKKRVRIKDVAEKAGVSTGTVDRVIHNRGKVAPAVKEKVLGVIKELGFERNKFASALAANRHIRIGVLMPSSKKDLYWKIFHKGVVQATKFVEPYGMSIEMHFFDLFNPKSFKKQAKKMLQDPPLGILFPPVFLEEGQAFLKACKKKSIPVVIINTHLNNPTVLSYIGQDSYQSGVLAARLLDFGLNSGETALILNLSKSAINAQHLTEKVAGFRFYLEQETQKNISIIQQQFDDFDNKKALAKFIQNLIKEHPKLAGIFFTNSRAHLVVDCLTPKEANNIKMVGFDLVAPNIDYLKSGRIHFLINQNPIEQGYMGIISLFNKLITKEKVESNQYLPLDIVVKENLKYYLQKQELRMLQG